MEDYRETRMTGEDRIVKDRMTGKGNWRTE
jgi:hypothetical protein